MTPTSLITVFLFSVGIGSHLLLSILKDGLDLKQRPDIEAIHYIERSLPNGYVKDGTIDYTGYIQAALLKYNTIIFPGFPILINDEGLKIPSNRNIKFLPGSEIRMKPTAKGTYNIFRISSAANIILDNPVIRGDRLMHLGRNGEFGMGIGIYSSTNIAIKNARIYDCWGDGIYIGRSKLIPNKNITISNVFLKNNRRSGISIISVDGLEITDSYVGFSQGASPMCGINMEPHQPEDELKNITIRNTRTEYNGGNGISVGLSDLYGKYNKSININIINHADIKSKYGFKSSCYLKKKANKEKITGEIRIINPIWKNNTSQALKIQSFDPNVKFTFIRPAIIRPEVGRYDNKTTKTFLSLRDVINTSANYNLSLQ